MIKTRSLRTLNISAASGLLFWDNRFYVIADDELNLYIYPLNPNQNSRSIPLFKGELPEELRQRKKVKPDLESLANLSANEILAIPSGSKPNRCVGALVCDDRVTEIDFEDLFSFLVATIPDLNIEGSVITQNELLLFHRGNGPGQKNYIVVIDLAEAREEIAKNKNLTRQGVKKLIPINLGKLRDQNLTFTDAAIESSERIWFLAVTESGLSTYEDGEFDGAVLGCMDSEFKVLFQDELNCETKPEGLAIDLKNRKFYVVTDADDRSLPSQILEGQLSIF